MLQAGWGGSTALSAFPTLLNQFLFSFSLSFSLPLPSPLSCLLRPLLFTPLPSSRPRLSDSSPWWDRHSVCCTKCFSSLSMPLNTDATVKVHLCVGGWVHPCVHVCMRACVYACVCVCVCVRACVSVERLILSLLKLYPITDLHCPALSPSHSSLGLGYSILDNTPGVLGNTPGILGNTPGILGNMPGILGNTPSIPATHSSPQHPGEACLSIDGLRCHCLMWQDVKQEVVNASQ